LPVVSGQFDWWLGETLRFAVVIALIAAGIVWAQTGSVTGSVSVGAANGVKGAGGAAVNANAVVWLKPAAGARAAALPKGEKFKIIQKRKRFEPHVLAVPVGSAVDFPNLDPFFHNVFSLFDGKRFDLGLYEAGSTHTVTFDRAGVSYIFCNIHPEMSAIVVAVDAPYFALTNRAGEFSIANVPAGRYLLNVWHERGKPDAKDVFPRQVEVPASGAALPPIRLIDSGQVASPHKNKYGRDYDPPPANGVYK
jgi:plastocyanin